MWPKLSPTDVEFNQSRSIATSRSELSAFANQGSKQLRIAPGRVSRLGRSMEWTSAAPVATHSQTSA